MSIESLIGFEGKLHVADIGAAVVNDSQPYKPLFDRNLARLTAVDGDERWKDKLVETFGQETVVLSDVIADGASHKLYLCAPMSGMSSILKPSDRHLAFFNGFSSFGRIERVLDVKTRRLADIEELVDIDFLKMDVQGAELTILRNAGTTLDKCVAIQLEASFIPLYENQPTFGEIDQWMRENGFHPHRFVDLKCWSITPTIRNNNFRVPFNQLLECDLLYIRGLVDLDELSEMQLKKIILIAFYCYGSPDLAVHALLELKRRNTLSLPADVLDKFFALGKR